VSGDSEEPVTAPDGAVDEVGVSTVSPLEPGIPGSATAIFPALPAEPEDDPTAWLKEARDRIAVYRRGTDGSGSTIARLYTAAVDNTLRSALAKGPSWLNDDVALIAVGGYGRKELCPHSDVDLALVVRDGAASRLADAAPGLLYPLWDAGLSVGQRAGTIDQLLGAADGDSPSQVAWLEHRFVAGSRSLFAETVSAVDTRVSLWREGILGEVRDRNLDRFGRYGQSVFLLEPQVKEGKGGLRDFHWLRWISRLAHGARGSYDLLLTGLVEPEHHRALMDAHEFLLRVRIQLHLQHGRAVDVLGFDSQEPVARALGFKAGRKLRAVENFMGAYYRHGYAMAHYSGLYVARLLGFYWDEPAGGDELAVVPEVGPSAPVRRRAWSAKELSGDGVFELSRGSVKLREPDALARDPHAILALFEFLQRCKARLHHETIEQVRAALPKVGKRFREDPGVGARFTALLEGADVFRTLVAMHRSGFLGRYLPEWQACFCQAQHNRVHLYTVDVHCLYVVRELERLGTDEGRAMAPAFADVWAEREQRATLILAGLFHDIAKAHGTAHSRVGADMAGRILRRIGWDADAIERVQWLVRHHLVLSELAYHRDLHDPATQGQVRAVVPSQEAWDELFVLTWADTRATNPTLLTSWKQALLRQAWAAGRAALGEPVVADLAAVRARVEALLLAEVGRKAAPELLARLLSDPLTARSAQQGRLGAPELAEQAVLLGRLAERTGDRRIVTTANPQGEEGASVWTVCADDRPGLFADLAGTLTACGFSIHHAEATTRSDGIVVDRFAVTDGRGRPVREGRRWTRLEKMLGRVVGGEIDLDAAIERARKAGPKPKRPGALELQRVTVSNDESATATVVEVVAPDRVGLVYDAARTIADFGLDVKLARVATRIDLAADTFYVLDSKGRRLGDRRQRKLAAALRLRFGGTP